jgi:hypothetical protein
LTGRMTYRKRRLKAADYASQKLYCERTLRLMHKPYWLWASSRPLLTHRQAMLLNENLSELCQAGPDARLNVERWMVVGDE